MLEKFKYRKAALEDIDELVRTRIIVLRAANKLSDDVDMDAVEHESYAYYKRALEKVEHIAYEETGRVTDCVRSNGYGPPLI